MDSTAQALLWLVGVVCIWGFFAVGAVLVSYWKKFRIIQRYMHEAPLPRLAGIEGDIGLVRMRCADMQKEINGTVRKVEKQSLRLEKIDSDLGAEERSDESEAKLVGLVLAERLDALSARLDAVELACGLREKPKTMGGTK